MEKYRLFEKIIKTKWYSFYASENTETRELVTVKKLHKQSTWEQILKNRNVSIMNNNRVKEIANIREIVKDESNFYCIFDNLDLNLDNVIRGELQKEDIFKLSRALIQLILHLNEHAILPREIRPSSLFTTPNFLSLRIAHLQAFAVSDLTKLDLVELQDLRYSSPESVLTSKAIDERSMIFAVGLIISELILGKPLLTANTKINYIYELCKLFPEERLEGEGERSMVRGNAQERFQAIIAQYNFSNEFIALLKEMLKVDRNQRIKIEELLEAFDLIVANQENFIKESESKNVEAAVSMKANVSQAPINKQILEFEIDFEFEKKPTLSAAPNIKLHSSVLPAEKNVDDDTSQPIIIKQSSKPLEGNSMPITLSKDAIKGSRTTKQQTISTVKRPQLTNYAMNEGNNLGVRLGFQPTLFSENDNDF